MAVIINKAETPSIIAKTTNINGEINSSGVIEIEGKTKGIIVGNIVVIRECGSVEGKIEAEQLNIYGTFNGDIKSQNINVYKKAKIVGNIEYKSLSVEDGASIDGQFKMINKEQIAENSNKISNKIANENNGINKISNKLKSSKNN